MKRKIYCDHLKEETQRYHYEADHATFVLCYECFVMRTVWDKVSQQTGAIYE